MVRYLSSLGAVLVLPFTWCKFTLTMSSLSRIPNVLRSSKETHGLGIMSGEGYHGTIVSLLSYQKVKGNFEILPLYQTDLFLFFSLQYVSFSSGFYYLKSGFLSCPYPLMMKLTDSPYLGFSQNKSIQPKLIANKYDPTILVQAVTVFQQPGFQNF